MLSDRAGPFLFHFSHPRPAPIPDRLSVHHADLQQFFQILRAETRNPGRIYRIWTTTSSFLTDDYTWQRFIFTGKIVIMAVTIQFFLGVTIS